MLKVKTQNIPAEIPDIPPTRAVITVVKWVLTGICILNGLLGVILIIALCKDSSITDKILSLFGTVIISSITAIAGFFGGKGIAESLNQS